MRKFTRTLAIAVGLFGLSNCGTSQSEMLIQTLQAFNVLASGMVTDLPKESTTVPVEDGKKSSIGGTIREAARSEQCTRDIDKKDGMTRANINGKNCLFTQEFLETEEKSDRKVTKGKLTIELIDGQLRNSNDVWQIDLNYENYPSAEEGIAGRVDGKMQSQRYGTIKLVVTKRANQTLTIRMEGGEFTGEFSAQFESVDGVRKIKRLILNGKDFPESEYRNQVRDKSVFTGDI